MSKYLDENGNLYTDKRIFKTQDAETLLSNDQEIEGNALESRLFADRFTVHNVKKE